MMVTKDLKMADVIHMNHFSLSILDRFGIELGFGDKTVEETCREFNVDYHFFLEIINAFIDKDYFPKKQLQGFSVNLITDYLQKTHTYYIKTKVPEIEGLIDEMVNTCNSQKDIMSLLKRFFFEYNTELQNHIMREEKVVFPYTQMIEKAYNAAKIDPAVIKNMEEYSIDIFEKEHDDIEEKLFDLKNILIKYLPQPNNKKLCHNLLHELFSLEKDINDHSRIEDKVLVPKIRAMEKEIKKKAGLKQ
ncbi:MAG: hemerythrin domain-containing protein [Bacteroidales bacterium]|jgi:regulator of cell morphogenesis and NO signaling|nr:hemerythrin domain-containing protein [Bacteroidales bacterium]